MSFIPSIVFASILHVSDECSIDVVNDRVQTLVEMYGVKGTQVWFQYSMFLAKVGMQKFHVGDNLNDIHS